MKDKLTYYIEATNIARGNKQVVGEKNEYYITLRQLEIILGMSAIQ